MHGSNIGIVCFDFVHVGKGEVESAVNSWHGYKYVLVVEDDESRFILVGADGSMLCEVFGGGTDQVVRS